MKYSAVENVIAGATGKSGLPELDVFNPGDGSVLSRVPLSGHREVDLAVIAAKKAWPASGNTTIWEGPEGPCDRRPSRIFSTDASGMASSFPP